MVPDIRAFLEIRSAAPVGFSPDGSAVLVRSNLSGTAQLYRVSRTGGGLRRLTDFADPVEGIYLPTTDEIVLSVDDAGNERQQLYLMNGDGSALRKLVHDPDFIHRPWGAARDGSLLAFESNRGNGIDFDVYVVAPVEGAQPRCVLALGGWCRPAGFSPDGQWLAVVRRSERNADNDLYLVDLDTEDVVHVAPHDDDARFGEPVWRADSSGFYFSTDCGRDRSAIASFDLASRAWHYVLERDWDCDTAVDPSGTHLLVTCNEEGYTRAELLEGDTLKPLADVPLPGDGVAEFVFSNDGAHLAYSFSSSREPGDVWTYDIAAGQTHRLTSSPRGVASSAMVEPELHRFTSFDGEQVPAFVYRPAAGAADAPVLVFIHGGPEVQFIPVFNPLIQYFVARGFAVVAPNVRGSTGYGKRYHHLDDAHKRLDAVADLASLHGWLREDPRFDADRVALWGGSYGGYMVLAGLAFQPGHWAAGVAISGISSLVTFLENTAEWRRAFREREYGTLAEDRDFLLEASPLNHVDQIRAPLMLIHGVNDPRVPVSEAEQIHAVLSAKGVRSELLAYRDEGHGLAKLANRLDAYPRAARFLEEILTAP